MTVSPGGNVRFDIDGVDAGTTHDQIAVAGVVNIAGSALSLDIGMVAEPGADVFFLLLNDGADAISGEFTSLNGLSGPLPQGAVFSADGQIFQISYTAESGLGFDGVGNDIALRAVPEPGSALLLVVGLSAVGLRRLRRHGNPHWNPSTRAVRLEE